MIVWLISVCKVILIGNSEKKKSLGFCLFVLLLFFGPDITVLVDWE